MHCHKQGVANEIRTHGLLAAPAAVVSFFTAAVASAGLIPGSIKSGLPSPVCVQH